MEEMADPNARETRFEKYRDDLNPDFRAGESDMPDPQATRTAYDMKHLHEQYCELPDDVLKQVPVLDTGTRLQEGATYFDMACPNRGEFRGMNDMEAGPENCYVAKSDVDYELWNRLIGVEDDYRLGRMAS
jgi:hypothetical protein